MFYLCTRTVWISLFALAFISIASAKSLPFTVAEPWQVPGTTLQPGQYTIQLLDSMTDRSIVEIRPATAGGASVTFVAIPNRALPQASAQSFVLWKGATNGKRAVRGWTPQNGRKLEFVYEKNDALAIAGATGQAVPAYDPDYDQPAISGTGLTATDKRIVQLWLLSTTRVAGSEAQVQVKKLPAPATLASYTAPEEPTSLPSTASWHHAMGALGLSALTLGALLHRASQQHAEE